MEKFLLLFRNGIANEASFQTLSPEAMQAELAKWNTWIGGIAAQGKLVSTEGLYPSGKVMAQAGNLVTDGPYAESKEVVGGFMLLKATDFDEAVQLAVGCPVFDAGGTVEVRQVQNFG